MHRSSITDTCALLSIITPPLLEIKLLSVFRITTLISGHRRPTDLCDSGAGEGAPLFSKGRRWPQMRELEQAGKNLL